MYFFALHIYVHYTAGWVQGSAYSVKFIEVFPNRLQFVFIIIIISKFIFTLFQSCVVKGDDQPLSASDKQTPSLQFFWKVVL